MGTKGAACVASRIGVIGTYFFAEVVDHAGVYGLTGVPDATRQGSGATAVAVDNMALPTSAGLASRCGPADHPNDCTALVALGLATGVKHWKFNNKWLTHTTVCDWELVSA